jgi:cytosine/adenosine deaminase-related metal-dependent hydrolase
MIERDMSVSIGADGAACNNRLDMFTEMRTAALLQKVIHGPEKLPAARVLRMATIDGARALGLEHEIGSLEPGKRADLSVIRLNSLHSTPQLGDVVSTLVYSAQPADVQTVLIDGQILLDRERLLTLDERSVVDEANQEAALLLERAGLSQARVD